MTIAPASESPRRQLHTRHHRRRLGGARRLCALAGLPACPRHVEALEASDLGALLVLSPQTFATSSPLHIGTWGHNKTERWALLTRTGEPWIWDFGSAAKNHLAVLAVAGSRAIQRWQQRSTRRHRPHIRAASGNRSTDRIILKEGVAGMPIGVDVIEMPSCASSRPQASPSTTASRSC